MNLFRVSPNVLRRRLFNMCIDPENHAIYTTYTVYKHENTGAIVVLEYGKSASLLALIENPNPIFLDLSRKQTDLINAVWENYWGTVSYYPRRIWDISDGLDTIYPLTDIDREAIKLLSMPKRLAKGASLAPIKAKQKEN